MKQGHRPFHPISDVLTTANSGHGDTHSRGGTEGRPEPSEVSGSGPARNSRFQVKAEGEGGSDPPSHVTVSCAGGGGGQSESWRQCQELA